MSSFPDLKLDWCSHEAAKYACEQWHYSRKTPKTKLVKIGVWENNNFIGCIIFSPGASPSLSKPYGLSQFEVIELTRVALSKHSNKVTKIISISIKLLKKQSPKLKLIVSFADPYQDHMGVIYQAGNWVYTGTTQENMVYIMKNGKEYHSRNIGKYEGYDRWGVRKHSLNNVVKKEVRPPKYRYLYPLSDDMRLKIEPLRKPYPKKKDKSVSSVEVSTSSHHEESGGSIPTLTHKNIIEKVCEVDT